MGRKKKFHAVYEDDLTGMLDSLGVLSDITREKKRCKYCRDIVALESVFAVFPESGEIQVVCNKTECVKSLVNKK